MRPLRVKPLASMIVCVLLLFQAAFAAAPDPLIVGVSKDTECWNPLEGPCGASIKYHDLVLETLLYWDEDLQLAPSLVTSWSNIDDLTWEFKLRQGVTFTNGEPFDAQSVVFMFDALLNPEGRDAPTTMAANYRPLERIDVIDDYTVRFVTSEPFPLLARYMAFEPRAVAPAYYQSVGADEFGRHPVGTGPYKLTEWVPNDRFVLEANEGYWGSAPVFGNVIFRVIPEDTTRVAELAVGGVHVVENVPADQAEIIRRRAGRQLVVVPGLTCVYINLRPEDRLEDEKLREAFRYATDHAEIIDGLLGGLATPLREGNCVTPYEFGYDPTIEPWPFDLEKAKQVLAESSYDGREIEFYYPDGVVAQLDQVVQVLQEQWGRAGLNVSIHKVEYGLWRQNWSARTVPGDIFLNTSGAKALDSDARLIPSVHCRNTETGAGRVSFYCNPEIDALIDAARVTVDPAERQALYAEAWGLHRDDAHHLTLYSTSVMYGIVDGIVWSPSIEGFWSTIAKAVWSE